MTSKRHPMQPVDIDRNGIARFRSNAIVRYLLDAGPFDMNMPRVPIKPNSRN